MTNVQTYALWFYKILPQKTISDMGQELKNNFTPGSPV